MEHFTQIRRLWPEVDIEPPEPDVPEWKAKHATPQLLSKLMHK
jgi:hypothetical protein